MEIILTVIAFLIMAIVYIFALIAKRLRLIERTLNVRHGDNLNTARKLGNIEGVAQQVKVQEDLENEKDQILDAEVTDTKTNEVIGTVTGVIKKV